MSQQGKDKNDGLHFLEKLSISQYLTVTFHQDIKLSKSFIKIFAEQKTSSRNKHFLMFQILVIL